MAFDTAGNIVNDAAAELGLIAFNSKPADPFGSTDANLGQLCQLLKSVGRNLRRRTQWNQLRNTWLFSTVANQGLYALPGDYDRYIDQTGWNRTNRLPLGGPLSPQQFEFFKARLVGVVFNILFDELQGQFRAYPDDTTPGNYAIAFEYMSAFWVRPAGTATPKAPWTPGVTYSLNDKALSGGNLYTCTTGGKSGTTASLVGTGTGITDGTAVWSYTSVAGADAPTASGDTILFDPQLVKAWLKLAFKLEKGFDATAANAQALDELEKAKNADKVAPVLSLHRGVFSEPLLGERNVPLTGFGGV